MVYLDNFNRKFQAPKVVRKGRQHERTISAIMDALDGYRSSEFEYEAACRHGLRQALCLNGQRWPVADTEAAFLVETALRRLGATRPTWDEGQWDHSISDDYCKRCHTPLDEAQQAARVRFCGEFCAKATLIGRNFERGWSNDRVGRRAYDLLRKTKTNPRQCEQCGTEFRVSSEARENRFCSKPCRNASLKTRMERPCEHCGTLFLPSIVKVNRFCSRTCYAAAGRSARYVKTCECCGTSFMAKLPYAKYCRQACNAKAAYYRKGALRPSCCSLRICHQPSLMRSSLRPLNATHPGRRTCVWL